MQDLLSTALRYEKNTLYILDQTLLPHEMKWLECSDVDAMVEVIQSLRTRGAPLIGIACSVLVAHLAEQGMDKPQLAHAIEVLRASRPTAVNLMNNLQEMSAALASENYHQQLVKTAEKLFFEDISLCQQMAENGAKLLKNCHNLLTHCNTGSLATVGMGTALSVIQQAYKNNENIHVYVDETRPLLQGGRLTAWELSELNIPNTIICDNMAASLMAKGQVDAILVGADRIAVNGDFANKIGTYNLAVLADYHDIPFYVVAPYTTIDVDCLSGENIPVEQRDGDEVRGVKGSFGQVLWSPEGAKVYNPAFDVTPAKLVTGWVLDTGVFEAEDIKAGKLVKH
ncbi:S-methyl-5-thioribose-1-phosphate isomerase [Piscirickettsia litoralis]|uniref:Methylthioribose-1-phosphate isomerase n=1 Tax=Piscirickettsia litoralis TaxID=1891921 RepID=A0ABX3A3F2_9GAMM|nr:S-methyl-5-thioribose-1-phosphate isomerase [Piscirickettsia litoralis]ODN43396.1 S-methyl-5-thioribose-1-phosphate isomerase [Piscirickettsia litoralis]